MIAGRARSRSASGITTSAFLAPPSACTRLPLPAARSATKRAVSARPTKETASIPGWSRIAVTASRAPWTRLTTPAGISATASTASMISCAGRGSASEGFSRNELPQAIA
jgi:hypothetical protein